MATLLAGMCSGQVIPLNQMVPWVPNVTVGVLAQTNYATVTGITNYPVGIVVTNSPYNADPTGATDSTSAINSAITAAGNYTAVYIPPGTYNVSGGLTFNRDVVTLRGAGPTQTILVGHMIEGPTLEGPSTYGSTYAIAIASGSTKGSTNMTFIAAQDTNSVAFTPGDSFLISSWITTDPNPNTNAQYQMITSAAGALGATESYTLKQKILILTVSGNAVTFTPPLVWDFTNAPVAFPQNGPIAYGPNKPRVGVGLENICFESTNSTIVDNTGTLVNCQMLFDSWITNCYFLNGVNYNCQLQYCADCYFGHNKVSFSRSSGSNHSGLYTLQDGGCLIEDNIFSDGLEPGLEWNDSVCGNAFFANFFTNNVGNTDIDMHNAAMVMNLFEEQQSADEQMDGYYGSVSHQTLFRDYMTGPAVLNRWTTFCHVVGCCLGNTNFCYTYETTNNNFFGATGCYATIVVGFPNIGNEDYTNTTGPYPYNFPGWFTLGFGGDLVSTFTNGYFVVTNTQVNTNIITGNFTNLWAVGSLGNMAQFYHLLGQDPVNTNIYYPIGTPIAYPTSSNVTFGGNTTVSNGWRIFISNQQCYQQLNTSNILSDIITGNAVITNQASYTTVWDANGVQTLPASYLYTNGAPPWWGSTPWPATGPDVAARVNMVPAQQRYLGITTGNTNQPSGWILF